MMSLLYNTRLFFLSGPLRLTPQEMALLSLGEDVADHKPTMETVVNYLSSLTNGRPDTSIHGGMFCHN